MSIIHIFFGSETTVPKFRKRLYGTTDLIGKIFLHYIILVHNVNYLIDTQYAMHIIAYIINGH